MGNALGIHIHLIAGARIATDACFTRSGRKCAEPAKFDPPAFSQSINDRLENRRNDALRVFLREVGMGFRHSRYEF